MLFLNREWITQRLSVLFPSAAAVDHGVDTQ